MKNLRKRWIRTWRFRDVAADLTDVDRFVVLVSTLVEMARLLRHVGRVFRYECEDSWVVL